MTNEQSRMIPTISLHYMMQRYVPEMEEISNLARDIEQNGIVTPLRVCADFAQPGHFFIVSGNKRYAAAVALGLEEVPCIDAYGSPAENSLRDNAFTESE